MDPHPCGIRPLGSQFFDSGSNAPARDRIGVLRQYDDEFLLNLLEFVDAESLTTFGRASHYSYALAFTEDLWKTHTLLYGGGDFLFRHTWRDAYKLTRLYRSYLSCPRRRYRAADLAVDSLIDSSPVQSFRVRNVYSDYLLAPWISQQCDVSRMALKCLSRAPFFNS